MSWEVTSRVRGGVPLSVADAQQFHALIATLTDTSRQFAAQSAAWATLSDQLTRTRLHVSSCPVHRDSWPGGSLTAAAMPRLSFIVELSRACEAQIRVCSAIAQHMDALTQLVARAQGLYLDAETKAAHASAGIPTDPLSTASSVLRGMASDILRSIGVVATSDDKSQPLLDILHTTSPYHQALMRGFSIAVLAGIARSRAIRPGSGMTTIDPLHGMLSRNSVNVAAEHLASISMQLNDRRQGNRIELSNDTRHGRSPGRLTALPARLCSFVPLQRTNTAPARTTDCRMRPSPSSGIVAWTAAQRGWLSFREPTGMPIPHSVGRRMLNS